jgi:7-carboxy-7-deazaguanine synthase
LIRLYNTFCSIQGESTFAGLPCFFIRLAGCPLKCSYCDTRAACESPGIETSISETVARADSSGLDLVEVTGGEPLAQKECSSLLAALLDSKKTVLLETSGAFSIKGVDPRVRIIMDIKCPDSDMSDRMFLDNLALLEGFEHELKFVVSSKRDFDWAAAFVKKHFLDERTLLISPVPRKVSPESVADWILASGINFRLQLQLHKIIWPGGGDDK